MSVWLCFYIAQNFLINLIRVLLQSKIHIAHKLFYQQNTIWQDICIWIVRNLICSFPAVFFFLYFCLLYYSRTRPSTPGEVSPVLNRGEGSQTEIQGVLFEHQETLTVRLADNLHRLPREVAKSLSLEVFKSSLDTVLENLLQVSLLEQEDWSR